MNSLNNLVLISAVGAVGYVAYKAMTTTPQDIGKSVGQAAVGVVEGAGGAIGGVVEGVGEGLGMVCDEGCKEAKHQADVAYAATHHNSKDDVRNNFIAFGSHADPNLLIKEGISEDMRTSGLNDRIREHTLNTAGIEQIVSDDTPIVIPSNGPIPVTTSQDHAVRQEVQVEESAIATESRRQFAATIFEGDDATFWRYHAAQFCRDNPTADHIWVGTFMNRHFLGSKIGFNNYTGREHVTCQEYADWITSGGHYADMHR